MILRVLEVGFLSVNVCLRNRACIHCDRLQGQFSYLSQISFCLSTGALLLYYHIFSIREYMKVLFVCFIDLIDRSWLIFCSDPL